MSDDVADGRTTSYQRTLLHFEVPNLCDLALEDIIQNQNSDRIEDHSRPCPIPRMRMTARADLLVSVVLVPFKAKFKLLTA